MKTRRNNKRLRKRGRRTHSKRHGGAGKITDYFSKDTTYNKGNKSRVKQQVNQMLLKGAYDLDLEKVKESLKREADINVQSEEDGNTALYIAIENGDIKMVDYLLKKGADIYIENKYNQDAFELALENDHNEYIREDIDGNPSDIDDEESDGYDQMIPGLTIRSGTIVRLVKKMDELNKFSKKLNIAERSRRVMDRENFSKVVKGRIPKELENKGMEYLGGKSKRKTYRKNKRSRRHGRTTHKKHRKKK